MALLYERDSAPNFIQHRLDALHKVGQIGKKRVKLRN